MQSSSVCAELKAIGGRHGQQAFRQPLASGQEPPAHCGGQLVQRDGISGLLELSPVGLQSRLSLPDDLQIVGGDHHPRLPHHRQRRLENMVDQEPTAQVTEVLARNALGPCSSWNQDPGGFGRGRRHGLKARKRYNPAPVKRARRT